MAGSNMALELCYKACWKTTSSCCNRWWPRTNSIRAGGDCWPGSRAHSALSGFPATTRLPWVREARSPLASGWLPFFLFPFFLQETPAGAVFLWGAVQAGSSRWNLLVVKGCPCPGGHLTVWGLVMTLTAFTAVKRSVWKWLPTTVVLECFQMIFVGMETSCFAVLGLGRKMLNTVPGLLGKR